MWRLVPSAVILAAAAPAPVAPMNLMPGIYTNEEDVYFAADAPTKSLDYIAIQIVRDGEGLRLRTIDKFGKPTEDGHLMTVQGDAIVSGACRMPFNADGGALAMLPRTGKCHEGPAMTRIAEEGITLGLPDGRTTMLRRARPVTCWGASLKAAKKSDGSDDWYGAYGLKLHDQGGRVAFGGGDTGSRPVVLRMRNVVWPSGPNRPSVVLYVHTPDQPDHAVGYSWADPDAKRIGINLRWMQASCTIDTTKGG